MIDTFINYASLTCSLAIVILICLLTFVPVEPLAFWFLGFGSLGVILSLIRIKRAA